MGKSEDPGRLGGSEGVDRGIGKYLNLYFTFIEPQPVSDLCTDRFQVRHPL